MSELPKGWISTTIGDVADVKGGKRVPKGKVLLDTPTDYPYIRVTDFKANSVRVDKLKYIDSETAASLAKYTISKEDLYISIAGTIGLVGEIPEQLDGAYLTENAAKICNYNKVDRKFFRYALSSPKVKQHFDDSVTSSGQPKLALFRIKNCAIELPPLEEQKRIADKLDSVLAKVEAAQARLDKIPAILKRFRQSVLAAATSGELSKEWSVKQYNLSKIADFQNGYAFKSGWFKDSGKYQVIKLGNIRDGKILLENAPAFVEEKIADEFNKYSPKPGDILISMTGTRFKRDYGFCCLVNGEKNLLVNQRVGRIIPNPEYVVPAYLHLISSTEKFRDKFFKGETGGVNQGNVGSKHIMGIDIEIPDIHTQIEIVNKVSNLLMKSENIQKQYNTAKKQIDRLTQSILTKAFKGELLTSPVESEIKEIESSVEAIHA
tara:strand:- start:4111 stop:5415 length:1305 start_codon:yes stop_codon:yes gene_type:complete